MFLSICAATVAATVLLVVGLVTSNPASHSADRTVDFRAAQLTYERAVVPLITDGGKTVELGIKVGISDLDDTRPSDDGHHALAPAVVAAQATSWAADLHALAARLRAIAPPPPLIDAHAGFVAALDEYGRAAELVRDAASADAAARGALLDEARAAGRHADERFDAASALLQTARGQLGLGTSPDFPDPAATR